MTIKRQIAVSVLVGTGIGLVGCQSTGSGGWAFWKRGDTALAATPDVSQQRFEGLSKQLGTGDSPSARALGATAPAASDNFLVASWKRTTAAVSGAVAGSAPAADAQDDPLRLDRVPKKVGPEVYVSAARLLENQNKLDEAEEQYQKALKAAPGDVGALVGLARLQDRRGNGGQAIDTYQRALKANPQSSLVYNDLGLCLARQQRYDQSIQALSKAVALQPDNPRYANNLSTVLVEVGRVDEALKHLTAHHPPAVAHYNVGYLLEQKGDRPQAIHHYQQALALDASLEAAREMLAKLNGAMDAQPLAAAPAAAPAPGRPTPPRLPSDAIATHGPRAAQPAAPVAADAYTAGAGEVEVQMPPPQGLAAEAPAPPSFHIGDDNAAAEVAARPAADAGWSNLGGLGAMQPLPPVE